MDKPIDYSTIPAIGEDAIDPSDVPSISPDTIGLTVEDAKAHANRIAFGFKAVGVDKDPAIIEAELSSNADALDSYDEEADYHSNVNAIDSMNSTLPDLISTYGVDEARMTLEARWGSEVGKGSRGGIKGAVASSLADSVTANNATPEGTVVGLDPDESEYILAFRDGLERTLYNDQLASEESAKAVAKFLDAGQGDNTTLQTAGVLGKVGGGVGIMAVPAVQEGNSERLRRKAEEVLGTTWDARILGGRQTAEMRRWYNGLDKEQAKQFLGLVKANVLSDLELVSTLGDLTGELPDWQQYVSNANTVIDALTLGGSALAFAPIKGISRGLKVVSGVVDSAKEAKVSAKATAEVLERTKELESMYIPNAPITEAIKVAIRDRDVAPSIPVYRGEISATTALKSQDTTTALLMIGDTKGAEKYVDAVIEARTQVLTGSAKADPRLVTDTSAMAKALSLNEEGYMDVVLNSIPSAIKNPVNRIGVPVGSKAFRRFNEIVLEDLAVSDVPLSIVANEDAVAKAARSLKQGIVDETVTKAAAIGPVGVSGSKSIRVSKDPLDIVNVEDLYPVGSFTKGTTVGVLFGHGLDGSKTFESAEEVVEYSKAIGVTDAVAVPASANGLVPGYYMMVHKGLNVTELLDPLDVNYHNIAFNPVGRLAFGADVTLPKDTQNLAKTIERALARHQETMARALKEVKLDKHVNDLIREGIDERKWFSEGDLISRGYSPKQRENYHKYRVLSDMAWTRVAEARRVDLESNGYRVFNVKGVDEANLPEGVGKVLGDGVVAREVDTLKALNNRKIKMFDADSGKNVTRSQSKTMIEEGKVGEYKVVELRNAMPTKRGEVTHVLVRSEGTQSRNLARYDVLNYVHGGPSRVESQFFVKGNVGTKEVDEVTGATKWNLTNPKTIFTAQSSLQARKAVDALNAIRIGLKDGTMTNGELRKVAIRGGLRISNASEFNALIKSGHINPELPIEAVRAGKRTELIGSAMTTGKVGDTEATVLHGADDISEDILSSHGFQSKNQFSERNEELVRAVDGSATKLVRPIEMLYRATSTSVDMAAINKYRTYTIASFEKTFGDLTRRVTRSDKDGIALMRDAMEMRPMAGASKTEIMQINAAKSIAGAFLNQVRDPSLANDTWSQAVMKLAGEFIGEAPVSGVSKVGDWLYGTDPVGMLRSLTFHRHLGLYNPSQLVAQGMTGIINSTTINPIGMALAATVHATQNLMGKKAFADKGWGKIIDRMAGFKVSDEVFSQFSNTLKNSGVLSVGDTLSVNKIGSVMGDSEYFYRTGNSFTQATAFSSSYWAKVREVKRTLTDRELGEVINRSQTLAGNQTRMAEAAMQRGDWGIFTQFSAYPMRILEAMTVSGEFTQAEKARLLGMQIAAFGLKGTLGSRTGTAATNTLYNLSKDDSGQPSLPPQAFGALQDGLASYHLSLISGVNVTVDRLGSNTMDLPLFDIIKGYFGNSDISASTFMPAPIQTGCDAFDLVTKIVRSSFKYIADESEYATKDFYTNIINDSASFVGTTGKARALYAAWAFDRLLNSKGQVISAYDKDALMKSFLNTVGITPDELSSERSNQYLLGKDLENKYNKMIKGVFSQASTLDGVSRMEKISRDMKYMYKVTPPEDFLLINDLYTKILNNSGLIGDAASFAVNAQHTSVFVDQYKTKTNQPRSR